MTAAGAVPVFERAEVFSVHRVGDLVTLTLIAPGIAQAARPGQFVTVRVGGSDTALIAPRALFVSSASPSDAHAGTITLVVAPVGAGTRWLARRAVGERIELLGPLGAAFPLPSVASPAVLLGHGYGGGVIAWLSAVLAAQGSALEVLLGAGTAAGLHGERAALRVAQRVTVLTDDGSAGRAGAATDALSDAVVRLGAEIVYACAPAALLRRVGAVAQHHAIRAQIALTVPMACGTGVCRSCLVPVRGDGGRGDGGRGDGGRGDRAGNTAASRLVRACVDGPAMEAGHVRWGDFRTSA